MKISHKIFIALLILIFVIIGVIIKNENSIKNGIIKNENENNITNGIIIIDASKGPQSFSPINISMSSNTIEFVITERGRINLSDIKGIYESAFILSYNPNVIIVQNVTEVDISGLFININNTKDRKGRGRTEITERFINESISGISSEYITDNGYIRVANISFKFIGSKNNRTILDVSHDMYHNSCYGVPNISDIPSQKCDIGSISSLIRIFEISYVGK